MSDVYVVGIGMTKFGKHPDRTVVDLGSEAVREAIRDAEVDPRRIEAAYCGHVFQGMVAGQRVLAQTGLAGIPLTNVEDACSSGAVAIREAALAIRAGEHDVVLAFGMEHLTGRFRGALTPAEDDLEAAVGLTMPAIYAMRARRHMEEFGTTRRQLALVSVKNKRNALDHPAAQVAAAVTVEEVLASEVVAWPVHRLMVSPVSDGAAAIVLAAEEVAKRLTDRPVWVEGIGWALDTSYWGNRDLAYPRYVEDAARMAYRMAGISEPRRQIHVVEPYDPFAYKELHHLEGLLLAERGKAPEDLARGRFDRDGELPSCPSGGLLGVGNPIAAAGLMKICELYWQLRGEAGKRQVANSPRRGLAQAWGDLMQIGTVVVLGV